jgi:hypothetical protein
MLPDCCAWHIKGLHCSERVLGTPSRAPLDVLVLVSSVRVYVGPNTNVKNIVTCAGRYQDY